MADISSEWDSFAATVVRYVYQAPSIAQDLAGITPATVVASYAESRPGANCPSGYVFDDKSTVLATTSIPTLRKDKTEINKDDKSNPRAIDGNTAENEWHSGVRDDISKSPKTNYKERKVYINPRWDLKSQLKDLDKERSVKIEKVKESFDTPEWIRKAYGKK